MNIVKVWARYTVGGELSLVYPTTGIADPLLEVVEDPDIRFKGRVMNAALPLTEWFPLRRGMREFKIGKMQPCYISAMQYRVWYRGDEHELSVDVLNPTDVDQGDHVTMSFAKEGIIVIHDIDPWTGREFTVTL